MEIRKFSKVKWVTSQNIKGSGIVVSDIDLREHVLVAMDAPRGELSVVIYCATTWLTPVGAVTPEMAG